MTFSPQGSLSPFSILGLDLMSCHCLMFLVWWIVLGVNICKKQESTK